MKKTIEIHRLKADLERCAARIFDLHHNPDHGATELQTDRLIDAENFVDHAIRQLLQVREF